MNDKITAILLAGGSSKRFGADNKLLALKDEQSLIHHALHNIAASQIGRLIIVLGHDAQTIEQHCHDYFNANTPHKSLEIEFAFNADFNLGIASSLKAGLSYLLNDNLNSHGKLNSNSPPLATNVHAAMVFLADMPSVNPKTINTLINASHKNKSAIIPTYEHSRGNPVILMPELFDQLLDVTGDVGAKQLLHANPDLVLEVSVDDKGILSDYDTPDQLHNLSTP